MQKTLTRKLIPGAASLSVLAFLGLWQILAMVLHSSNLPLPESVAVVFWQACLTGELPYHLGVTLLRLVVSFGIAMSLGCAIGILLGRHKKLDAFFDNWLVIFLNVPALVTIILCYVWFGLVESAAILAVVINKLPNVVVTVREGTRTLDQDLLEMARCYRFGKRKTFVHVIWPQLHPFVMAATRSGLALIWKIILVVELLGRSNGMGYQLHLFFQMFDVASILAYTIAFVSVIQLFEVLVLKPLDKKSQRWRR
ncbi:MAG: ABC transporter permease [Methylococcaceae bacterium]|nr:ABC transporter permease [Methylococcaceae bacterium]MDZ4158116.1 ABC transporter permease [Methylococcales bacterium]MDP2392907.1 ABC transporter permease [Methylococcaceae bacterium]MDP3020435.1 ABC transporter permease [Methylococcaceae bacterium]MDP3390920.1 ABC transporter permease [Methylococcaceae bacterium]